MSLTDSISADADNRVTLRCNVCDRALGTVHAPAPPVPVRCYACRTGQ